MTLRVREEDENTHVSCISILFGRFSEEERKVLSQNMKFARFLEKDSGFGADEAMGTEGREEKARPAFDIWIVDNSGKTISIIELKYVTKNIHVKFGGATFLLKSGYTLAEDIGMFVVDMMRMELAARQRIGNGFNIRAYSILLTNDPGCWEKKAEREKPSQYGDCQVYSGRVFDRGHTYQIGSKPDALGRARFTFENDYKMEWNDYKDLEDSEIEQQQGKKEPKKFRYLIVEVPLYEEIG